MPATEKNTLLGLMNALQPHNLDLGEETPDLFWDRGIKTIEEIFFSDLPARLRKIENHVFAEGTQIGFDSNIFRLRTQLIAFRRSIDTSALITGQVYSIIPSMATEEFGDEFGKKVNLKLQEFEEVQLQKARQKFNLSS